MTGEVLNTISVLDHELLLVEVGGGQEAHLAGTARGSSGRAAASGGRTSPVAPDEAPRLDDRWEPTTLCGRIWHEMAAVDDEALHRYQEVAVAPTCRSCLRVIDTWFPKPEAPAGIELLAAVIAEKVERSARNQLRAKGFRSETLVTETLLHVFSNDAYEAIDPALSKSWINEAIFQIDSGTSEGTLNLDAARDAADWNTWVVNA